MENLFGSSEDEESSVPRNELDGFRLSETSSEEDSRDKKKCKSLMKNDVVNLKAEKEKGSKGNKKNYRRKKGDKVEGEAEQKTPKRRSTRNRSPTQVCK